MKNNWQLQEAKNRFSHVVDEAIRHGPQVITRRGVETVVVVAIKDYRKSVAHEGNLVDFLMRSPLHGSELEIERDKDTGRDVDL